ncbi:MAG: hypothetical protein ACRDKB_05675 [Actinomycetota bacterium]
MGTRTGLLIGALFLLLVACSNEPKQESAGVPVSPTTTAPAAPDCREAEETADDIFALSLVATEAKGEGFSRTLKKLGDAISDMIFYVANVEGYLEDYGAYEGGDDCLSRIAKAEAVAVSAVGIGEDQAAKAYQLLLRYYPESADALDAENFLAKYGYPIPESSN